MTFTEFTNTYGLHLNEQQAAAVQAIEGPVLLLAVPGSGKTTVLVSRLGYMLSRGIAPENILTMTYTVAAAGDMRRRFAGIFGESAAEGLEFRTINGVCARIIRLYEREYGRKAFELMGDERSLNTLVAEICRSVLQESPGESEIQAVRTAITYAKNSMLSPEAIDAMDTPPRFGEIYREYQKRLRTLELMDYDDQLVYALQILRQCPELLQRLRERWHYICVDEAQDSSRIQHELFELLAGERGNLFMVGDEDQSIYGFRAACPEVLLHFEQRHTGARVLLMEKNYRCAAAITEAARQFIGGNRERREKHMEPVRSVAGSVRPIMVRSRQEQYAYLLKLAKACREETAVLYRDNDSALPLLDMLLRQGIPYRARQLDSRFFSHRIVRDIRDIYAFAMDSSNPEKFLQVYYKFSAGIPKAAVEAAAGRSSALPMLERVAVESGISNWTRQRCMSIQAALPQLLKERGDRAIARISDELGYGDFVRERGLDENKLHILKSLGEREESLERLLCRLDELDEELKEGGSAESPLILSTIHSSKGLEYERVFLMDVLDGLLPKTAGHKVSESEAEKLLEEERRLFYVAMTRAKNELAVFRFLREGRRASFADAVFAGPKKAAPAPKAPWLPQKAAESAGRNAAGFQPGTAVKHRQYGAGVIEERIGELLSIRFADGSVRKFSLTAALKSASLSLSE